MKKAQCWLLKLTVDDLSREGIFIAHYFSISMTIAATLAIIELFLKMI